MPESFTSRIDRWKFNFFPAYRAGMKTIGIATVNSIKEILQLDSVVEAHSDFSDLKPDELIARYLPFENYAK